MMHTYNDRDVVTNTLALYGVKRHSPAYYALRGLVRAAIVAVPLIGGFIYNLFG